MKSFLNYIVEGPHRIRSTDVKKHVAKGNSIYYQVHSPASNRSVDFNAYKSVADAKKARKRLSGKHGNDLRIQIFARQDGKGSWDPKAKKYRE